MTALVSFDRVFEVLDLPSTVQEKPGASVLPAGAATRRVRPRGLRLPEGRRGLAGQPGDGEPQGEPRQRPGAPRRQLPRRARARWWPWSGPPAPARPRSRTSSRGSTTSPGARSGSAARTCRDVTLQSLEDAVGYVTQDAHMFHDTIRENLRYARPDATDDEIWAALEAAQIARTGARRCPTGSRPSSATAATGSPAASGSGWRSPGCCSRRRRSSCSTRRPPTSTPSPSTPSSARSTPALEGRTSLVIAHRLSTVRNADQILVVEAGRDRAARHPPRAARRGRPVRRPLPHPVHRGRGRRAGRADRSRRPVG